MANTKYKRILLKLSGEALAGKDAANKERSIDPLVIGRIADEILAAHNVGVEVAVVVAVVIDIALNVDADFFAEVVIDRVDARRERNAGEDPVGKWIAQTPVDDEDLFVESIPFAETRLYVKTVSRNRFEYRRIYEASTKP